MAITLAAMKKELKALDAEIDRLSKRLLTAQARRHHLARLIELSRGDAGRPRSPEADEIAPPDRAATIATDRPRSLIQQIVDALCDAHPRPLRAGDLVLALAAVGRQVEPSAVSAALTEAAKRGQVRRLERDRWALPDPGEGPEI